MRELAVMEEMKPKEGTCGTEGGTRRNVGEGGLGKKRLTRKYPFRVSLLELLLDVYHNTSS